MDGFDAPIYLPLRESRRLARARLAVHGAGILLAVLVMPDRVSTVCVVTAMLASLLPGRRSARRERGAVRALLRQHDGSWRVTLADGRVSGAQLVSVPLLLRGLTVLRLRLDDGRRCELALAADSAPAAACRRLRVVLRHATTRRAVRPQPR